MNETVRRMLTSGSGPGEVIEKLGVKRSEVMTVAARLGLSPFKRGRKKMDVELIKDRALRLIKLKETLTYRKIGVLEGVSRQRIQQLIAQILPRPKDGLRCSKCRRRVTGMLHRHHPDYSKPETIDLLCVKCHSKEKSETELAKNLKLFKTIFRGRSEVLASETRSLGVSDKHALELCRRCSLQWTKNTSRKKKHPVHLIDWTLPLTWIVEIWRLPNIRAAYTTRIRTFPNVRPSFCDSERARMAHAGLMEREKQRAASWFIRGGYEAIRKKELQIK